MNYIVRNIADSLQKYTDRHNAAPQGLFDGTFGFLLFKAHYAAYSGDRRDFERYLDHCLETISSMTYRHTFCGGISGMLYALDLLNRRGFCEVDIDQAQQAYKNYLEKRVADDIARNNWDFLHGALGVMVYLTRIHGEESAGIVDKFIDYVYQHAIKDGAGIKLMSFMQTEGNEVANISLSHGMSSLLIFLSELHTKGFANDHLQELVDGLAKHLMAQQIDPAKYGCYFPHTSLESEGENLHRSRLGWCYGDLGVAMALWRAGQATNNEMLKDKATEVFLYAAGRRDLEGNMVRDACLCHGTAGIAQFFKRINREIPRQEFAEAHKYWIDQTMLMSRHDTESAGFKMHSLEDVPEAFEYSFLEGIVGIGLALIASLGGEEFSAWDEILLLS